MIDEQLSLPGLYSIMGTNGEVQFSYNSLFSG